MAFDFLAGCVGGCAGVLVGHPFDTVKVHLQTQDVRNPLYKGTFDCLKKIIIRDSIKGLYRGVSSPMGGVAFVNAVVFGVYGNVNRHAKDPNSLKSHFIAGSIAGLVQSVICSPMELVKTRLQLQGNQKGIIQYKGPIQCLNHIHKTEGFRGVFRGLGITALRDIPGFSSYFLSYEILTRYISSPNAFEILLAGGLAGTISWLITFPIDVVKSRIQADGMNGKRKYSGIRDCVQKSYREEGLSFYSRGLMSTLIRAFPMNAACFFVVSLIMKLPNQINSIELEFHETNKSAELTESSITTKTTKMIIVGGGDSKKLSTRIKLPQFNFFNEFKSSDHENMEELCRRKLHTIKSLIFSGALNEAVCSSELIELVNDLYDDHDFYNNQTVALL